MQAKKIKNTIKSIIKDEGVDYDSFVQYEDKFSDSLQVVIVRDERVVIIVKEGHTTKIMTFAFGDIIYEYIIDNDITDLKEQIKEALLR